MDEVNVNGNGDIRGDIRKVIAVVDREVMLFVMVIVMG